MEKAMACNNPAGSMLAVGEAQRKSAWGDNKLLILCLPSFVLTKRLNFYLVMSQFGREAADKSQEQHTAAGGTITTQVCLPVGLAHLAVQNDVQGYASQSDKLNLITGTLY